MHKWYSSTAAACDGKLNIRNKDPSGCSEVDRYRPWATLIAYLSIYSALTHDKAPLPLYIKGTVFERQSFFHEKIG